jgi:hypothetical protein
VAGDIPSGHAGELSLPADALAAYQQVIDRYSEDPTLVRDIAIELGAKAFFACPLPAPPHAFGDP